MTKIKILVTKEILQESMMCNKLDSISIGYNCAFSLAIRDILPQAFVSRTYIIPYAVQFIIGGEVAGVQGQDFGISEEMTEFIGWFDDATPEERVAHEECSFELEIPDWVIEKIDIQGIINSPTLELA